MTAAVVAPLPIHSNADLIISDPTAEARKRRREILASQRSIESILDETFGTRKKSKISEDDTSVDDSISAKASSSKSKKPQMKYDPDVPMSKEEAAAWRREQRRKRNRESAAASRQRQRDRIEELEVELDEWKMKYEEVMKKVRELEEVTGCSSQGSPQFHQPVSIPISNSRSTSPQPPVVKMVTPRASPTVTNPCVVSADGIDEALHLPQEDGYEELLPPKMISRPAVKITGTATPSFPVLSDVGCSLAPDACVSEVVPIDPIIDESDLYLSTPLIEDEVAAAATALSSSDPVETELGEFLLDVALDAVDWL